MKVVSLWSSFFITLILILLLDNSWVIKGNRLPPLGKFLDPFHGFWNNIEPGNASENSELHIPGLKDVVTVVYDSILIPHIFANNDEDLYLAQGFVTATHRLWQMEFQTYAAAGRVTEITGPGKDGAILNYDRGQRRLGMVYGAERALQAMMKDPTSKMLIEKYSEGVNQYIASLSYEDLPFEYKLLDYKPEPWKHLNVAYLLQTMAQSLNMSDKDMEMTNALKLFGKDVVDLLYPDQEQVGDPIVSNPARWKFKPTTLDSVPLAYPDELIITQKLPQVDPTTGSNNWAVSGSKTSTGSPMLCSDPHLNLSLPSIWFAIQLNAPGVNVMGASLPGAPTVVIGFNDSIAWGITNAQRDVVDWFKIKYQDNSKDKYLLDGEWQATKKVVEQFNIRGEPIFYDTIVFTHWGPVTYDKSYHGEKNVKDYAFKWIAHEPSNEMLALGKLNRAKNHSQYMKALDHFESPAQNIVFASVSGDIGIRVQGKFPVRRKDEGRFVLDGSKSSNGWQAFIPYDQNVMSKNPTRGFESSANQYPVDSSYPYYVTANHFEAYRNRRINKILTESSNIKLSDLIKLQNDNYNLKAEESLPTFLSYLDTVNFNNNEKKAFAILKSWNYYNTIDAEGASYYEAWWDNLMPMVWDEMEQRGINLTKPTTFNTITLIKEKPNLDFFDIRKTTKKETAGDVIQAAFKASVKEIDKWTTDHSSQKPLWADYKDSYIGHLLRIEPLNIHVRHGGNHDIVNAHSRTHGPSWRMVVSLEKTGIKTWATYPGGQSGNPGSKHYSDMLDNWVNGKYFALLFLQKPEDAANKIMNKTTLTPAQ